MIKPKPVLVYWIDSMGTHGWAHDFKTGDLSCVSVGHLISKTKDRILLCMNLNEQQTGNHMEIPIVAVKRIKNLKCL